MSTAPSLHELRDTVRRRRALTLAALALPLIVAVGAVAWRVAGGGGMAAVLLLGVTAMAAVVLRATRRLDDAWVARQLDARRPDLEDSSDLLLCEPAGLGGLQRLQRFRIEQRLAEEAPPDLRPAWPVRALAISWVLGAAVSASAMLSGRQPDAASTDTVTDATTSTTAADAPRLLERHLDIEPPAYTGLPMRSEPGLDAKVPAGAVVRWRLRFEPQPASVEIVFHDGRRVALVQADGAWSTQWTVEQSALYRLVVDRDTSSGRTPLHRLEVIADQPPVIRVVAPSQNVTLLGPGLRQWSLDFEASDDYGLGTARLQVTLAQGGGENISVSDRTYAVRGDGDGRQRRYAHRLDLAPLGLAAGDDVIVRLRVDDNRRPKPQTAQSASLILRWRPQAGAEPTGLEGMVQRTLPAYFRSQRQVIVDTETLAAGRGRLPVDRFVDRSDEIGVDQRLLRLRYGQFLGEEAEDGSDAAHDEHAEAPAEAGGSAVDSVTGQFGHTHDLPEAATLLDRETRELLRGALREMWQAELHLRQGQPERALPYEYRALDRIKQVQQASRIYLARVGLELPPIDAARRLTGDVGGVRSRRDVLEASPVAAADAPPVRVWQRLGASTSVASEAASQALLSDLDALATWVRARETGLPQAIELLAATDVLANDPRCSDCARQLRALLWPLLPVPATATGARGSGGPSGAAYLDALQAEAGP